MATKIREEVDGLSNRHAVMPRSSDEAKEELASMAQLLKGVESVAGAARLSIAAVADMLDGKMTPMEATVINTATGRVLKACELNLKYARASKKDFVLPEE